jgi:uncharacterized protein YdhG (YjbR/CyaY superfamily)
MGDSFAQPWARASDCWGRGLGWNYACKMCSNSAMRVRRKPSTIDDYLKGVPEDRRQALENLRAKIRSVVPNAEECIRYRMPAFRLGDAVVAGFLATTKGCSYFPFSGSTLQTLTHDVSRYDRTKGSLHFSADKPLPTTLVRKLLRTRIAEIKE